MLLSIVLKFLILITIITTITINTILRKEPIIDECQIGCLLFFFRPLYFTYYSDRSDSN